MNGPGSDFDPIENRILARLPPDEIARLRSSMEQVTLDFKQVLYAAGDAIRHVYFPMSGVVSWLSQIDDNNSAEVATIGNEGVVGLHAFLGGNNSAAKVMVQVPGRALRMKRDDFQTAAHHGGMMVQLLHRYLDAFLSQITQSVGCNTFHSVEKRCCRWLLMTHDRVRSDRFPLTHELLAQMLGVRRASITVAASKLQKAGLIRYVHGKIDILDRARLEAASCSCYRTVKKEYDRLLG
jgi:CRP-like cAMP-binding protein